MQDHYLARIEAAFPDLPIESLRQVEEGLVNDVLIVNEAHAEQARVFRFAKTEQGREALHDEALLLDALRLHVDLPLPAIDYYAGGMVSYPFIPGQPLTDLDLRSMPSPGRARIIEQLGTLLHILHTLPIPDDMPDSLAHKGHAHWLDLHERVQDTIVPLMWGDGKRYVDLLFAPLLDRSLNMDAFTPALINGDLAAYHILFDPDTSLLTGIIDWGTAGVGDPAADVGMLINVYGESVVQAMTPYHPEIPHLLDRARFIAAALELEWLYGGLTGDDPGSFVVHIGRARDWYLPD